MNSIKYIRSGSTEAILFKISISFWQKLATILMFYNQNV